MYHNYAHFNSKHLFLRFNNITNFYQEKSSSKYTRVDISLIQKCYEEFLFKADRMHEYLERMNRIDEVIVQQVVELQERSLIEKKSNPSCPKLIFPKSGILEYNSNIVNEYLGYVSPFLNALFVLQDRILRIIGIYLKINEKIPNKLPGFYDFKKKRWKPILKKYGANIENEVKRYFNKHAKRIRKYRNLDQHDINLLEFYGIDHQGDFHLYLPDDPKVKDYSKISFRTKIDSLLLFNEEFRAFHIFVEKMMRHLGISEKLHQYGVGTSNQTVENFNEGECMASFQVQNEMLCLYCGEKNEKNAAKITTNKLPLKNNELLIRIK